MIIVRVASALLAVVLTGCEAAPPSRSSANPDSSAEITAIRAQSQAFDSTLSRAEEQAFLALLADSVMWMVPNQPALVGKDAVRDRVHGRFAVSSLNLRTTIHEIRVAGDWAYVRVSYRMSITPKNGGAATEEIGKGINMFEKAPNGSWLVTRHIWNADHPDR